jgi:hypothetical protein
LSETCPTHNILYKFPETCYGCEISAQAYRQGYIDGAINALTKGTT